MSLGVGGFGSVAISDTNGSSIAGAHGISNSNRDRHLRNNAASDRSPEIAEL